MVELMDRGFAPVATIFLIYLLAKRHKPIALHQHRDINSTEAGRLSLVGCQKQHDTNTKKDDIFVQELPVEVPRYWVGGYAPFDDTGCREEKRPRNRKRTNSHQ